MDSVELLTGVEAVEDAINRFYAGGERDLHNALLQFQASPQAWTLVWPLLGPTKVSITQFLNLNSFVIYLTDS